MAHYTERPFLSRSRIGDTCDTNETCDVCGESLTEVFTGGLSWKLREHGFNVCIKNVRSEIQKLNERIELLEGQKSE